MTWVNSARTTSKSFARRDRRTFRARPRSDRKFAAARNSVERHQQTIRAQTHFRRATLRPHCRVRRQLEIHPKLYGSAYRLDSSERRFSSKSRLRSLPIHSAQPGSFLSRRHSGAGHSYSYGDSHRDSPSSDGNANGYRDGNWNSKRTAASYSNPTATAYSPRP